MTDLGELSDGEYVAVVDSIEGGLATVFFEDDGSEVGDAVIDGTELPDDGRHADAVLSVTIADGEPIAWDYDTERTESRSEQAQRRFDRLSERPPSDEDS